ncbi:MAG: sugar phosphate isomerase/epimerase [Phycisphaerales bacterium]|nr:MAG: sugar phosphate isomerase/epimerase [Phycisphaerales bacterium]
MNRRDVLHSIAGGLAAATIGDLPIVCGAGQARRSRLGVAQFSYNIRLRAERSGRVKGRLADPLNFLDHCRNIGAGGVQMDIGVRDDAYTRKLRERARSYDMFVEGSTSLPRRASDVEKFDATVRTAKEAGATVVRVAIGGRRYEQFDTAEQFKAFAERTAGSLQLAEPVMARHRMQLAIENHKDWRIDQMLGMLRRIGSEYVGVCVDTGNSFALLEDPMAVVEAYAPYASAVHLKDMAVAEYEEGFLLADVTLGKGILDLRRMVQILRKAKPEIQFTLEMATRDPLKVPCLTEKYWATLEDARACDLARALRYVRANASPRRLLPEVNHLPLDELLKLEEDNIKECLAFAKEHLNL